jgi:hypothetical protein
MLKQSCKAIEKEFFKSFGVGEQNSDTVLTFLPNHFVGISKRPAYRAPHFQ